jgi:hypothetical protein
VVQENLTKRIPGRSKAHDAHVQHALAGPDPNDDPNSNPDCLHLK